ncbi:bacitracin ABC transporter ATP-binding protein [Tumebacillus algifaecis]|uniref:Bacitracin ABC transporter ATP-binding protein n=1 Tax=Tumebacillus algifaecis TaxID=1214604 RepID=A0A223D5D6_9BACL|nr:ABC transporter ATP-binding protein [Tumebacillus algifaecis]ASS76673.1 bacitracin ABC transporter ATP-binding protein [Tumebacillus algifaecis]
MGQTPVVQIRNLTKKIGNKTLVEGLTFDIPRGEVFGFLGPNGAGKTTTIRMIVGLMKITEGQVMINGKDVEKDFEAAMTEVGAIVENPEMYKFISGYNNLVHFARMNKGVTMQRIDEVIKLVGLENRINDKVKTYSLGMRQRLGLAQALLHKPSVLILDEPTNGLDPAGIRELRDHLRMLAKQEGLSVIVSSHLLTEMELMCDRIAVIQNGKLIDVKPVREMVGEAEQMVVRFELDRPEEGAKVLEVVFSGAGITQDADGLELTITREQIADVNRQLVQAGLSVFGIRTLTKSLEDRFLEMTGGNQIV